MSLTQTQIDSLNRRESARWEKACVALTDAGDRVMQLKDDISTKKNELDKLNAALQKVKGTKDENTDAKKKLADELKERSQRRALKRSPTRSKQGKEIDD